MRCGAGCGVRGTRHLPSYYFFIVRNISTASLVTTHTAYACLIEAVTLLYIIIMPMPSHFVSLLVVIYYKITVVSLYCMAGTL